jgi:endo-1,4-beta-xylanase
MKKNLLFTEKTMSLIQGVMRGVLNLSIASSLLFTSCTKNELDSQIPTDENMSLTNHTSSARIGDKFYANSTGTDNGYYWTIDKDGSMGSAYFSFDGAGTTTGLYPGNFLMSWTGVKQVVGGKGWAAGTTRNKVVNYNVGSLTGSIKFLGVYGWTKSPLTEYYVCEKGPGAIYNKGKVGNGTTTATYTSNGNTYSLTKSQRVNAPSIEGTATFWQFESLRTGTQASVGVNGAVDMNIHFNKYKSLLNPVNNPSGKIFGTTLDGGYMVFGCEAYDYSTTTASVTGSLNATVW